MSEEWGVGSGEWGSDNKEQGAGSGRPVNSSLLPTLRIRRARGFRLYTETGKRLADLWQAGGAAVLGHNPPGLLRELKNTASRGLFAPLPSYGEGRLLKALARLFPGREVRLYGDEAALGSALAAAGYAPPPFPDPALGVPGRGALSLWRPFLNEAPSWFEGIPALIPVLPLPWPGAPQALILTREAAAAFPPSRQPLSPLLLAAAARSIHDLIASERDAACFPVLEKALARNGGWVRRGIYLSCREPVGAEAYAALFRRFLDAGFLIPPEPGPPLILPGVLSPGEEAKLAEALGALLPVKGSPESTG